jgi:hypothetical protein
MLNKLKQSFYKLRKSKWNLNMIVIIIAIVMIWRWIWWILDKILFPDHPMISYLVSVCIWIVILLVDNNKLDELSHH